VKHELHQKVAPTHDWDVWCEKGCLEGDTKRSLLRLRRGGFQVGFKLQKDSVVGWLAVNPGDDLAVLGD
jgi:hypothetical protein